MTRVLEVCCVECKCLSDCAFETPFVVSGNEGTLFWHTSSPSRDVCLECIVPMLKWATPLFAEVEYHGKGDLEQGRVVTITCDLCGVSHPDSFPVPSFIRPDGMQIFLGWSINVEGIDVCPNCFVRALYEAAGKARDFTEVWQNDRSTH